MSVTFSRLSRSKTAVEKSFGIKGVNLDLKERRGGNLTVEVSISFPAIKNKPGVDYEPAIRKMINELIVTSKPYRKLEAKNMRLSMRFKIFIKEVQNYCVTLINNRRIESDEVNGEASGVEEILQDREGQAISSEESSGRKGWSDQGIHEESFQPRSEELGSNSRMDA